MKKIVTLLCIALLAFTSASLSVLAAPTPKQVKNFGILEFNLKQTKSGEAYIKAFEAFAKKNWNNRTYLKDLKTKLEKLLVSGAVKSTNDKLVLSYLDAKI
ncbi:MAG: hypothetical protein LBC61_07655 [Candidatus Peribacteria bacterium]|jgi:Skp family chaperone for outer membrane proteins|nr:hypothetical protein [Candidatus Peribacteria bacterium]